MDCLYQFKQVLQKKFGDASESQFRLKIAYLLKEIYNYMIDTEFDGFKNHLKMISGEIMNKSHVSMFQKIHHLFYRRKIQRDHEKNINANSILTKYLNDQMKFEKCFLKKCPKNDYGNFRPIRSLRQDDIFGPLPNIALMTLETPKKKFTDF